MGLQCMPGVVMMMLRQQQTNRDMGHENLQSISNTFLAKDIRFPKLLEPSTVVAWNLPGAQGTATGAKAGQKAGLKLQVA